MEPVSIIRVALPRDHPCPIEASEVAVFDEHVASPWPLGQTGPQAVHEPHERRVCLTLLIDDEHSLAFTIRRPIVIAGSSRNLGVHKSVRRDILPGGEESVEKMTTSNALAACSE
jgi:hypothetical protein